MDTKIAILIVAALAVGAVGGGLATASLNPAAEGGSPAGSAKAKVSPADLEAAQKDAAEARTEAAHWKGQVDRLEKQLQGKNDAPATVDAVDAATDPLADFVETGESAPRVMDAALWEELQGYREQERERQEREREREERSAERRGDWARMQTEMLNRRTDMFTDLIERTDDPAEQQRWADIERQMTYGRDLMREMRDADTDEARDAVRESLRQNFDTMQNLMKQQQNAVLKRALEAEGIQNADQVAQIQRAVQSSLGDEAFQMGGGGPPSGFGRGWGGPRGGFGDGGGRGSR